MKIRIAYALKATLCLVSLIFSASALADSQEDQPSNPLPTQLSLMKIDDQNALIKADFHQSMLGDTVSIGIGSDYVLMSDMGDNGDEQANDGIFSTSIAFNFDEFVIANQQLADRVEGREIPLFQPGGRQLVGMQTAVSENGVLRVSEQLFNSEVQHFDLPLEIDHITAGQEMRLPLHGPALALTTSAALPAIPASIPHSLMITDLGVVNDPQRTWACMQPGQPPTGNPHGEWTFWELMSNISNGTSSTSDYIKQLFNHWNTPQVVNGHMVVQRPNVYNFIIQQWEKRSGGPGTQLLPHESPFRLLGIVLRMDLRGGGGAYGGGDAGEARFVFSLHDGQCNSMAKTIILEYKVPISGCTNVRHWAQQWKALATSSNYNNDLAQLTQVFSAAGASPMSPNQSAISQVRTNELLAGSPGWELREFVLPAGGGFLQETTVKQEPDNNHNNSQLLANFVNNEWPLLVGPPPAQHTVTNLYNNIPFLAGSAPAPTLWNAPNSMLTVPTTPSPNTPLATVRDDALFELALNTCSGCHLIETGTPFAHLDYNTPAGQPAFLSGFLTGISLPDPRAPSVTRQFNDLARRAIDLDHAAAMSCPQPATPVLGNALVHQLSSPAVLHAVH